MASSSARILSACISSAHEKDHPMRSSMFQSPKRKFQRARRKKLILKCSYGVGVDSASNLSSCLDFEPCDKYYNFKVMYDSLAFFGSKTMSRTGRRMHMNGVVHSGKAIAMPVQNAEEVTTNKKLLTKQRRVVVTGLGVVTPLGHDPDVFYNSLLEGISGISKIETFDCAQFPTRIAGEIKSFLTDGWVSPKIAKRADKFMLYLITAGKKALADSGVTEEVNRNLDKSRCGVIIGSALGGMKVFNDGIEALRISYKKMNPFCIPFSTTNMGSAMLAMDLGWMGPNYSISTACATSNFCMLNAAYHISRGETDLMLCGGSEAAIIPIGLGGFLACKALSQRNSEPTKASCPWDINRDGFVIGEGAGVLLLEELEHAKRRGAKIYAEFLGGSFTCDAYHMTEPHPDGTGVALCIEKALAQSGVNREDVNYINAYATSTPTGDLKEYRALIRCFGNNPESELHKIHDWSPPGSLRCCGSCCNNQGYTDGKHPSEHQSRKSRRKRGHECACRPKE